ncbi:MAG: rhamnulokinase [Vicinamibacterales bacterium]
MNARFLALDLGAESGRAVVGDFRDGRLSMREVHRFANEPVRYNGALQWDILRLWQEIRDALDAVRDIRFTSVGVDSWGCDFGLLGERGNLLENPYHYRDSRTDGVMSEVTALVPPERIYGTTGVQFLPFNTLFQLYAACQQTPLLVDSAASLATIPDLFNYWLTGELRSELTIASTTQFVEARSRDWATELLSELGIPTRLLPPLVEPGTLLGAISDVASKEHRGTRVVAPACHDTGSAVASIVAGGRTAFLSSGTWSMLGTELQEPIVTENARRLNFTNEGGVCGTTRLLKNIAGLWLLQACRRCWTSAGHDYSYDDLVTAAADSRHAFRSLIDPDCPDFLHPGDMVASIAGYCRQTSQAEPTNPPAYARAVFESLAFKYRTVLEALEEVTGTSFEQIRVVGGGARNRLLNQFTADATGRSVIAGPVEATALGNIAMQMLATGHVSSLVEARAVIERSFPVERYEPSNAELWNRHYPRFLEYLELTCA